MSIAAATIASTLSPGLGPRRPTSRRPQSRSRPGGRTVASSDSAMLTPFQMTACGFQCTSYTVSCMTYTVTATGIRKAYGDHVVLDGIDLAVEDGSVFSLL